MKIEYRQGDLLSVQSGIIVHGCNAQGVMGSGVAKAVREKYPDAYEKYRNRCMLIEDKSRLLGRVVWYHVLGKDLYIANAITQLTFGSDGKQYVSYEAIEKSFNMINSEALNVDVHIPMIGAGLGGGDWEVISGIIESSITNAKSLQCWVI